MGRLMGLLGRGLLRMEPAAWLGAKWKSQYKLLARHLKAGPGQYSRC